MNTRIAALAATLLRFAPLAACLAAPAAARAQTTLTFDDVATSAASGWSAPLDAIDGFGFFNFRVLSTADPFGTGANARSGTQFAYGGLGESSIYRTDVAFSLFDAYLSFRTTDGDTSPLDVVVTGYRGAGPAPVFTRTLSLTNGAQRFDLGIVGVEEVVFDLADDSRFAVLAVDDVRLATVPEPGTVVLVASGLLLVMGGMTRRRRRIARS
jgi:hypothetical protein